VQDWALEQAISRDADVARWTYYAIDMTEQEARARIQETLERSRLGSLRRYAIVDGDGAPVGTCGVAALDSECPRFFYAVLPEARGRGLATSATRLLAEWALAGGYATVSLETLDGNAASERVARKAGFVPAQRYQAQHRGQTSWLTLWTRTAR
jgi:RimJ/RimL family protein N-acetyltransferase